MLIAIADIFFIQIVGIAGQAFQAIHRLSKTATIEAISPLLRLCAITGLTIFVKSPTVFQWSYLYFITATISGIFAVWQVSKHIGFPILYFPYTKPELREGFYFAISCATVNIYNDIDKTMLARFSTLEATGIYGAAYKIIEVGLIPIRSLLCATYPKFFQHGQQGIVATFNFTKKIFIYVILYSIISCILFVIIAPIFPYILGPSFKSTVSALFWLIPLLALRSIHFIAADTLTGANYQGNRTSIQVIVAIFNVLINLWLIPKYSWTGAALSSLISDGLLAVLLWSSILVHLKNTSILKIPSNFRFTGNSK